MKFFGLILLWNNFLKPLDILKENFLKRKLTFWEMKLKGLPQSYLKIQIFFLILIDYKLEKP
ncbi:MAG TPA: hypothetical protein DCP54_11730 [Chryseobacterium sp.]|nr:hypothetical protein [Chryseobacterium sp.]